ncbi:MAG: SRPBCC family protein [Rothia sp. (in: high G+C Gram-positive bacteria)]|nr:SRPBCC family protein [Rothia sp. (in: high G+C Gram-positive bacteria)]
MQNPDFLVARETTIAASPARVRDYLRNLHSWEGWSPWQELDPAMSQTYTGPQEGVGASMSWEGNKKAGAGSMRVVTDQDDLVEVDIEFRQPFPAKNRSHFRLLPAAHDSEKTLVRWEMTGKQNLIMKVMFIVFRMKKSISQDFDRGLAKLKQQLES